MTAVHVSILVGLAILNISAEDLKIFVLNQFQKMFFSNMHLFSILIFKVMLKLSHSVVHFSITSWENCPGNQTAKFYIDIKEAFGAPNRVTFSGYIDVEREITSISEVLVETNRCDIEMKTCEKLFPVRFTDLCKKINDKTAFYYEVFAAIHPPLKCPIEVNRYTANNCSVDLSALSFLPLRDHVWRTKTKLFSGKGKAREIIFCLASEMKIVQVRRKKT
ncbi:CLUMA_CG003018, isoform A [Clunio marinus]|uniref:CLUMA_CG003018, isoform A n=1 Tax=Clunio marinus TaxID=568069 RepID=A0A1J1HMT5_9DIPT|nr:CLUMA_CG003018, isoform A [Clunio marinus]